MVSSFRRVEVLPPAAASPLSDRVPRHGQGVLGNRRVLLFLAIFSLSLFVSLVLDLSRPEVFRASAMLLFTEADATDEDGNGGLAPAAVNDVNVQSQLMMTHTMLSQVLDRLRIEPFDTADVPESTEELRQRLKVVREEDSGLLELRAEGSHPGLLAHLVNTWLDVYMDHSSESIRNSSASIDSSLREQLTALETRLAEKRNELDEFRKNNDITSLTLNENQISARLNGLNTSLNRAKDQQATAEAELAAMKQMLEAGELVGRPQDNALLDNLEARAQELHENLANLGDQFTEEYLAIDPDAIALRKRLSVLEEKIRAKRRESARSALSQAQQAVISSRMEVEALERQLNDYKNTATAFTATFSKHEALQKDVEQLEELHRASLEKLMKIEAPGPGELPRAQVLQRAVVPGHAIRPDYYRDAGIGFGVSLLLGLVTVILYDFFTRSSGYAQQRQPLWPVNIVGTIPETVPSAWSKGALDHEPDRMLQHFNNRELSSSEVLQLLLKADGSAQLLIAFVLSGLNLREIASLRWSDVDLANGVIQVPDSRRREIAISSPLKMCLLAAQPQAGAPDTSLWPGPDGASQLEQELAGMVSTAAVSAGLDAKEVTVQTLRNTYIGFLARQGIDLAELIQLTGRLSSPELALCNRYLQPGHGLPLEAAELTYPSLRVFEERYAPCL